MLARANRLVRAAEFRATIRRGQKHTAKHLVISTLQTAQGSPVRFGFVIGKTVGNAVVRNRVRRRMRAAAYLLVQSGVTGIDVAVRGLPGSSELTVAEFAAEFAKALKT